MQTIPSPTRALLAMPAIHAGGLENSIVFHQLPAAAQDAIRSTTDPQTKVQIAVEAGDQLPVMAEMYEHYVAAPARRFQAGSALPCWGNLDEFFLPGVLCEADRLWIRTGQAISAVEVLPQGSGWGVQVLYADGQVRNANANNDPCPTAEQAAQRQQAVQQAAYILGLMPQQ